MRSVLLTFLLLMPGLADAQIPVLNVSTTHLAFFTSGTSLTAPSQQVRIKNSGSGTLSWRATASAPWLRLTPAEGTAPSTIVVSIDTAQLKVGDYTGKATITAVGDADDSPATIDVTVKLVAASKPPPDTSAPGAIAPAIPFPSPMDAPGQAAGDAGQIRLVAPVGSGTPVSSVVEIGAPPGRGSVAWTARSDQRWLTVDPQRGTTPGSVTVKASPTGLPPGDQNGTLQFVDASGAPLLTVPVVLSVGGDRAGSSPTKAQLAVSPTTLPPATRNLPYSQAVPIKGGTPPYSMRILQGRLPPGLTLANGAISGISSTPGVYQFVLGVADSSSPQQTVTPQMWLRVITIFQNTALLVLPPTVGIAVTGNQKAQQVRLNIQSGGQALDWHASTDAGWLKLVPADGLSPGVVQLEVAQGMAPGTYMATVTVMMEGVANSPARIPVQLVVRR